MLQDLGQAIPNNQVGIVFLRQQLRVQMGLRAEQTHGA
jgi:hypothetical protein